MKLYTIRMMVDEAFFGFARTGKIGESYQYPALLRSGETKHITRNGAELYVLSQQASPSIEVKSNGKSMEQPVRLWTTEDIVVVPDGAELIQRPKRLVERLREIRSYFGYSKLIYVQGVADPYLLPILVYAGVSFFDDSTLRIESAKSVGYTIFGRTSTGDNPYVENVKLVEEILDVLGKSIRNGTIREIVEKYQISSKAMELLRLLDNDESGETEGTFPRRTEYIKANSLESLRRPDLVRFRNYISHSYTKPEYKKIALLIPCSARKPYSTSKSHKQILEALSGLRNTVHEIIVTSPVGLVPRELENTYPANSYDIPVIGEWYEDEKVMINNMLRAFFERNSYDRVYAFVKEDLYFILEALPNGSQKIEWSEHNDPLGNLRKTIQDAVSETAAPGRKVNHKLESFIKVAEYQFGSWVAPYLQNCRIIRNYNTEMIVREGKPVLVYNEKMGKFTINKNSAAWFLENGKFLVEIDDFKPTANVYAVGVLGTTSDIRQEDEVVLHHKGVLKGVGIAKMPTAAMIDLKKGTAVKVRN